MTEAELVRAILLAYNRGPYRLFRNTVGFYKDGNRGIHYGLCPGSADLIGWKAPEGRFIALEAKVKPRKPTPEQVAFLLMVDRMGGIAGVVYSMEDAALLLGPPP